MLLLSFYSKDPTCVDEIQNQNETGVDCGGVCSPCFSTVQDLKIKKAEFVFGGNGTYDAVVRISNPNGNAGSPKFSYKAELKGEAGNVIDTKSGQSYIMPAEDKYIPMIGFAVGESQRPTNISFEIMETEWKHFNERQQPPFSISSKGFKPGEGISGGEAYGIVRNESPYDFGNIRVVVVLRDLAGNLLGVNTRQIQTVRSGEARDFPMSWPYRLPGEVASVEVEAETNIYDEENFLRVVNE